ncbi:dTDP-4-dehydrorhamnose reductase [Mycobacterium kansasii]|uniref:dTDP-4-dehydrorhamnose reductase n=1 Tax=Mycobacterium kansasii TaxID=1768 RepID=A0A1V3XYI0_MYCKA|nr:dTDP-4-dehydrorhamnose reductase [Mycobacterium kansasii]
MSGRIVITGAGGQLGRVAAAQAARAGREVLAQTSSQWDITDPGAAGAIIQTGDVVLNCAAYTDVDAAESDEARAYAVNASGPEHLARACARVGARLIHVSTDYVFNGDFNGAQPHPYEPGDATAPQSVYARSKLAGEQAVLAALPQAVVVRTAWVYTGGDGTDFVAVMRRLAAGDGRSTWSATRPDHRPMWPTWPPRCWKWPAPAYPEVCYTPPTKVRSPGSPKLARCSKNAAPTPGGCARSAVPSSRGPRRGRATRR